MDSEITIVQRVMEAKGNSYATDDIIREYMPFIKNETIKVAGGLMPEDFDDALSVAMIGFHEAVERYIPGKGAFLSYAAVVIRSRVVDFLRKEVRQNKMISISSPASVEQSEMTIEDTIRDNRDDYEEFNMREATIQEIKELTAQLSRYGLTLNDVASNCPKQHRTIESCRRTIRYSKEHPSIIEEIINTGKLPIKKLSEEVPIEKKVLERHRRYLMAVLIIYSNGYEIIRGHLKQIFEVRKVVNAI